MFNYKKVGQLMLVATGVFALTSSNVYGIEATNRGVDVTFVEGEGGTGPIEPPIPNPEVEIPIDPELPGGPLGFVHLMGPFNFGKIPIEAGEQRVSVIASEQPLADGTGNTPYVDFINVEDVRGTSLGWQVQASLSNFTSTEEEVADLQGIEIELRDGVRTQGEIEDIKSTINLNNSTQIVMHALAGTNEQISQAYWGNIDQILASGRNESIQLVIPTRVSPQQASYSATITWTLIPDGLPS